MGPEWQSVSYSRRIVLRFFDLLIGLVELLLGLRILLLFLGANPSSEFVAWLYGTTDQLLAPFAGIFPSLSLSGQYVVDLSSVFAMLAYAFFGWLIIKIVTFLTDEVLKLNNSL